MMLSRIMFLKFAQHGQTLTGESLECDHIAVST